MGYLGFWVTRNGIKFINRKIEVINNRNPPTSWQLLQSFMCLIDYYRNMWPSWSHMLETLTRLTSIEQKFKWTQVEKGAFDWIKLIMARNNLLTYPYFNEKFKICTNASAFQLRAVIIKKGKPISFYSIKLTDDQQWYTVT